MGSLFKKKKQTVGYKYYLGMHMVLCHSIEGGSDYYPDRYGGIRHIYVDGKECWPKQGAEVDLVNGPIPEHYNIDYPELFGGDSGEGGVQGNIDILHGSLSQGPNSYLVEQNGEQPTYRGVLSVVLKHMYVGTSTYLKKWSFLVSNYHYKNVLYTSSIHRVGEFDMNPAMIILECLTNRTWGMGYTGLYGDTDKHIDVDTFLEAAATLRDEELGMSILLESQQTIEEFIREVLRHIDAVLYINRTNGKFCLKLIRNDYVEDDLSVLDESNIATINDFSKPALGELTNSITVNCWDVVSRTNASVTVQNAALYMLQGREINTTVQYPGITNKETALRLAQRDLNSLSTPLVRCTIETIPELDTLSIGDVFKLSWKDYAIDKMVMRIVGISYGTDSSRRVRLTCVQDVFATPSISIVTPPPIEWEDPLAGDVEPIIEGATLEIPYYEGVQQVGQAMVDLNLSNNPDSGMGMIGVVKPSRNAMGAYTYASRSPGAEYEEVGETSFMLSSTLAQDLDYLSMSASLFIENASRLRAGTWAIIGDEIIAIQSVTRDPDTANYWFVVFSRGAMDTQPRKHSIGDKIYFIDSDNYIHDVEYTRNEDITFGAKSFGAKGTSKTYWYGDVHFDARAYRPYPPQNVYVRGYQFEEKLPLVPLEIKWAHRNRLQQTGADIPVYTDYTLANPEAGTKYKVQLLDLVTNAVLYQTDWIDERTHNVPEAELPSGVKKVRMVIWSKRQDYECLYPATQIVTLISSTPTPITDAKFIEAPYYTLVKKLGKVEVDAALSTNGNLGMALISAMPPLYGTSSNVYLMEPLVEDAVGEIAAFGFKAYTIDSLDYLTTTLQLLIPDVDGEKIEAGTWAQIEGEIVAVESVVKDDTDTWTITIKRGSLDTQPATHAIGSEIYFVDQSNFLYDHAYSRADVASFGLSSILEEEETTTDELFPGSVAFTARANSPYPPQNVKINGVYYNADPIVSNNPISLTWAHRNRLTQIDELLGFTDTLVTTPEAGTTYRVEAFDAANTMVYTSAGINGVSHAIPSDTIAYDIGTVTVYIYSDRGGYSSLNPFKHTITITGTPPCITNRVHMTAATVPPVGSCVLIEFGSGHVTPPCYAVRISMPAATVPPVGSCVIVRFGDGPNPPDPCDCGMCFKMDDFSLPPNGNELCFKIGDTEECDCGMCFMMNTTQSGTMNGDDLNFKVN